MRAINTPKESYPLTWPDGWPRSKSRGRHTHDYRSPVTVGQGCEMVMAELVRLGVNEAVLSSNMKARLDGMPYSGQSEPGDRGVAVYFTLKGRPTVLACDKWDKVGRNLWAIAKHVEAIRGQERWGVGNIEQAFAGYARLPGVGETSGFSWWKELGVPVNATAEQIKSAYRDRAKVCHPDGGGTHESMARLNDAFTQAMNQNGRNGE